MSGLTTPSPRSPERAPDPARKEPRRAAGEPRLASAVQFGMCAAALAGVIAFGGGAAGGGIAGLGSQPETTCCPPTAVLRSA